MQGRFNIQRISYCFLGSLDGLSKCLAVVVLVNQRWKYWASWMEQWAYYGPAGTGRWACGLVGLVCGPVVCLWASWNWWACAVGQLEGPTMLT